MPPTPDLSFTSLDEFVHKPIVENYKTKVSKEEPKVVKKNDDAPIIEEHVSDNEEEDVSQPKIEKKIVKPSIAKIEFVKSKQQKKTSRKTGNPQMDLQDQGVIDSGYSRHMTGNMSYLTDYKEIDRGYVAFGGNPKGRKITGKVLGRVVIIGSVIVLRGDHIGKNITEVKIRELRNHGVRGRFTGEYTVNIVSWKQNNFGCQRNGNFKSKEGQKKHLEKWEYHSVVDKVKIRELRNHGVRGRFTGEYTVNIEDANLKLLRSLPPAWNTHTLIMRNKSDLDTLSMDDLYNNLKVTLLENVAPKSQENRNGDNTRRVILVETPANALVINDEMGYDWSYQAEEGPTDFTLMAFSSLGSSSSDTEDTKTLWEAIKTRFGGNKESKKIQKTILKQQYKNFAASRSEGLDKTYDRF
nr:ribonuclease H-like domain-containing protein [Tanacetum cinerariifolium]